MQLDVKELQALYEQGQNEEIIKLFQGDYPRFETAPTEILEIVMWAYFRFEEYELAKKIAMFAYSEKGSQKALELIGQMAAYVEKDDQMLSRLREELPSNSSVCNAFAIRARDPDSKIPTWMIVKAAFQLRDTSIIAAIHVMNNAARMLLSKGNGEEDIVLAIFFWEECLRRYGDDKNWHHRAAVYFWMSHAYEKIGELNLAYWAALQSKKMWERQIEIAPNNPRFKESAKGADARIKDILAK